NVIPGFLGDGVGGVTDQERGRVVLPFAAGLGETDHVLGHEIVHAFQRDVLKKNNRAMNALPLWFIEGMAEYLSIGGIDTNTSMWLRDAVAEGNLPRIADLDNPNFFPYRYGQALWAYLAQTFGDDVVSKTLASRAKGGAAGRLTAVTGKSAFALSEGWHAFIRERAQAADATDDTAKADAKHDDVKASPAKGPSKPIVSRAGGGRLNVGPALSPDGKSLVFLSERDQYSIDVYVADSSTGAISRKLVETAGDPHFESLQFIESAGGWDPSGKRFALAALAGGLPVVSIFDVHTGALEREFPIHGTDQVFGPTWSPDGKRIAFSGMAGGLSDLYVLDLEKGTVQALTKDAFADVQPAWSPDGRTIAFATDRFSSSLDTMSFGHFQLATIDVDTAVMRPLPSVPDAKNIDPHWSHDGASLLFVADGDGISNIYRLDVSSGDVFRITSVSTGVSGVTALSPALSVASHSDRIAYSVYRHGSYEINVMDVDENAPQLAAVDTTKHVTPPPVLTPAPAASFSDRPYRAGLSLDRFVQPYLSAGGGSTGGFIRGGVGLSFGDMLGNRQLDLAVQAGKNVDDFIAQAAYLNMHSRWNWGVLGGQVPWLSGSPSAPATPSANGATLTQQSDIYRQLHREVSGVAIYPFSGAKRLELTTGVQSIAFDRESTTTVFSQVSGQPLSTTTDTSTAAPTATLFETGAALVYDTSVWGAASPILGQRYRFSIAPTFGSMSFTTVTADYRKYVMPLRPFTIAMRVMEVGRFGSGASDPRLLPLAWTLRDVVRGYGDIGPDAGTTPYLLADRMLVGNVELRFPIPGVFSSKAHWSALPVEGLIFSDAGRFWIPDPSTLHTTAASLHSVGAGVRIVAAGVVFELDAVKPLDQFSQGWTFSFNFRPGF
ncbi:MAG TPA: BamA/TamA family outer membrane protein, partial [Vicinamibacterales bacterium]|nr:BamA/TamA family outer membrane protein [Vicinamibacterales bacterium]